MPAPPSAPAPLPASEALSTCEGPTSAKLCAKPAAIAVPLVSPPTAIGFLLQTTPPQVSGPVLLPFPSSPLLFTPQAMRVPFESSATLWLSTKPAEIAMTPGSPLTAIGVLAQALPLQLSGPVLPLFPSSP